ncbi:MAG: ZIP family metal transporter [Candidatus Omnitrophica bacterium]|nr:ZIP family metal transporter [Candidatus Omnitrophota bacterium]
MIDTIQNFHPVVQALAAGIFTWGLTALGAAFIFVTKGFSQKIFDSMLGFAGGVMIAASFWSLLAPAIEMSYHSGMIPWLPAAAGFLLGTIFLRIIDKVLPHLHLGFPNVEAEGIKTSWRRSVLLVLAITIHNIPEGLAVGVAIGAVASGLPEATMTAALALAVGIGIQNIPEGFAVSVSLRREGVSRFRSFWYGQLSAIVEPIAAVLGAAAVLWARPLLPYALGFAAGAMIFVVVEEVIPESQRNGHTDLATGGAIIGFVAMMILDVAFG